MRGSESQSRPRAGAHTALGWARFGGKVYSVANQRRHGHERLLSRYRFAPAPITQPCVVASWLIWGTGTEGSRLSGSRVVVQKSLSSRSTRVLAARAERLLNERFITADRADGYARARIEARFERSSG